MKRHESLAPLSREHHGALILAQLIKRNAPAYKGLPTDIEGKVNYAINFYKTDLIQHFSKEEIILEKVKHTDAAIAKLAEEIIAEHTMLTSRFLSLNTSGDKITALDELGHLLEAHIRKEERILFPLIQEHCSEEILSQLITDMQRHMKKDIENRKDIELLVRSFYDKVKADDTIGYIFNDIAKVNWEKHLPVMFDFWENVLFYTGGV